MPGLPSSAHDRQGPVHSELQQTFCWHMPELQSPSVSHEPPSGRLPQLPLVQVLGGRQSASLVQVVGHPVDVVLHM